MYVGLLLTVQRLNEKTSKGVEESVECMLWSANSKTLGLNALQYNSCLVRKPVEMLNLEESA